MSARLAVGAAFAAGAVAVAFWLLPPSPKPGGAPTRATASLDLPAQPLTWFAGPGNGAGPQPVPVTGLEALPASLAGTEVPDGLAEDAQGHLVVRRGVRDVFDYFLSAAGEVPRDQLLARLQAYLRSRLRPLAADEAQALLQAYVQYQDRARQELGTGSLAQPAAEQFRARQASLRGLRQRLFAPPVAAAFFGDEDLLDDYTAAKLELLADASLDPVAKAQRIGALRQRLPAALRDSLAATELVVTLNDVTAQWRLRAGDAGELRKLREGLVGAPAADRLEALDRETGQWRDRVSAYLAQREQLLADASQAPSTRAAQLAALRSTQFNQAERQRLEVMERLHDEGQHRRITGATGHGG